ncbi:MAG: phosphonopyruvate decarboxylase [Dehalococcoidales bacterium]|nr:MAG: phosphonopyruvate decarboxylase [Dehalococcoidales bacterium]
MVTPDEFVASLKENNLGPFIGVPCSILAPLIGFVLDNPSVMEYINPTNEAHALGLASGYYLGSGKIPVVFLQNSGLGNIINPLTSLNQIYKIPAFLLMTWRGSGGPGTDAPEHDIMGRDLEDFLRVCHLPYQVLTEGGYQDEIAGLAGMAAREKTPVAAVVKEGFFAAGQAPDKARTEDGFTRYEAIGIIKESLRGFTFLSTTGYTSRESFVVEDSPDFYMVGSMGLISAIGCGVAMARGDAKIAILDGDGAILMHLGLVPFIGSRQPGNLFHFVLDNQVYASTEGQPTIATSTQFDQLALASGYRRAYKASSGTELKGVLQSVKDSEGPVLVWVRVAPQNQGGTGRVTHSPEDIKRRFIEGLGRSAS